MGWVEDYLNQAQSEFNTLRGSSRTPLNRQQLAIKLLDQVRTQTFKPPSISGTSGPSSKSKKGPSTVQRIIDVLSRPLYATANTYEKLTNDNLDDNNPLTAIGRGLAGKDKTTFSKIINERDSSLNGPSRFIEGLAADIFLDPSTYVGTGLLGKILKGGAKGVEALTKSDEAVKAIEGTAHAAQVTARKPQLAISDKPFRRDAIPMGDGKMKDLTKPDTETLFPASSMKNDLLGSNDNLIAQAQRNRIELPDTAPLADNLDQKVLFNFHPQSGKLVPNIGAQPGRLRNTTAAAAVPVAKEVARPIVQEAPVPLQEVLGTVIPNPTRNLNLDELGLPQFGLTEAKTSKIASEVKPEDITAHARQAWQAEIAKSIKMPPDKVEQALGTGQVRPYQIIKGKKVPSPVPGGKALRYIKGNKFNDFNPKTTFIGNKSLADIRAAAVNAAKELRKTGKVEEVTEAVPTVDKAWMSKAKKAGLTKKEIDQVVNAGSAESAQALIKQFADKPLALPKAVSKASPVAKEIAPEPALVKPAESTVDEVMANPTKGIPELKAASENLVSTPKNVERVALNRNEQLAVDHWSDIYAEHVSRGTFKNVYFNQNKQVNLFNELYSTLKHLHKNPVARFKRAITLFEHAELKIAEHVSPKTGLPIIATDTKGNPISYAKLIRAYGPEEWLKTQHKNKHLTELFRNPNTFDELKNVDPKIAQMLENSKAAKTVADAPKIETAQNLALAKTVEFELDSTTTLAEHAAQVAQAPKIAQETAKAAGAGPDAVKTAVDVVREAIAEAKPPVIAAPAKAANDSFKAGKSTPDAAAINDGAKQTEAAVKQAGTSKKEMLRIPEKMELGIAGTVLRAFDPAFGMKDLNPILRENNSIFQARTNLIVNKLNQIASSTPKADVQKAFMSLTPGFPQGVALSEVQTAVAKDLKKIIDDVINPEHGTASRLNVTINQLNHNLRLRGEKDFKFSSVFKDRITGQKVDLSKKPGGWVESIYHHQPDDPIQFIKRFRAAADAAMMKNNTYQTMKSILSVPKGTPGSVRIKSANPILNGAIFPKEIADQIPNALNKIEYLQTPHGIKYIDDALHAWKMGVTVISPSYHIRNAIGDITLAFFAGVNNPKVFVQGTRVVMANRKAYKELDSLDKLLNPQIADELLNAPATGSIAFRGTVAGRKIKLDMQQMYVLAHKAGILPSISGLFDIIDTAGTASKIPNRLAHPFNDKVMGAIRRGSEAQEHSIRIGHFIDALGRQKGAKSFDEAVRGAANEVRKWHPDGLDLTKFEREFLRRVIPFYSWTRKAIPLTVEATLRKPGKVMVYPKIMSSISNANGISNTPGEPFPTDQLFPDWLADLPIGPAFGKPNENLTILNPGNPATDTMQIFNHPLRNTLGMTNPAIRVPFELGTGNQAQTGVPIQDRTEYIDKQIPILTLFNRMFNQDQGLGTLEAGLTGDATAMQSNKVRRGTEEGGLQEDSLLNYLFGLGMLNASQPNYIRGGQFDLAERLKKQAQAARQ